ncbi:hypothetical protein BU24DRAFT_38665 [Aaosphaeria arxii CBS 175.79]|uniref:Methyltransferase type 11 domain-containing protein n=1 Tax=Aaosphaeria arxii CBS 175.79 TaxID=1450172 RepID=A0A6A5YA84_9PLEO|nr:uncharacterized protein BU24DRAFT_38665 [Aaosphaeria arxii CBS 175.79]KAF2022136.1 hypothetical protein BU24DRAFT_38665 [Aaosphaeria arxii CBS 175.79]
MASYKSHLNPPRRSEEQGSYTHINYSTRLPQRSVTPSLASTPQPTASSQSKLQKRRPSRDEATQPSRTSTRQRIPTSRPAIATKVRQGSANIAPQSTLSPNLPSTKTVRQISSSRLPKLEVAAGSTRTPSLVSGSSASTVDSPRPNVLRRKPSSIGVTSPKSNIKDKDLPMSPVEEKRMDNILPGGFKDPFSETVLGISLPPSSSILSRSDAEVEVPENLYYDFEAGPLDILPLPTPQYALSTTPSTRYSESPGAFSISSTPTSMSSYSPGAAVSTKGSLRMRQTSPLQSRPPVTRLRTPDELNSRQPSALSSVRESSTSSSSASTILAEGTKQKDKISTARLPAPPASPQVAEEKPRVQAPPELAHLADPPVRSPELRRPTRPSREGTAEISGLRGPSPIIQSNMTSFPSAHRRTSSTESKSELAINGRTRFGIPSKTSSRNPSPSPHATPSIPVSRVPIRGPTPDIQKNVDKRRSKTHPGPSPSAPPTAPSPSKTSRFGFFRRKTEPVGPATKPEKKPARKGPAAGTGHEGYGRYALRGRSASSISGASIGRSASAGTTTESLDRTPSSRKSSVTSTTSADMDDFFLERLNPVAIRGTGSSTELTRSPEPMQSSSSVNLSLASNQNTKTSSKTNLIEESRPTLLPSAMSDPVKGASPVKKMPLGIRRPSDSDDDTKRSFLTSLTTKRPVRSSKIIEGGALTKVTSGGSVSERDNMTVHGKEGKWLKSKKEKVEKTPAKPAKKWNFFQRAQATARVDTPVIDNASPNGKVQNSRSMAHYALMDSQSGIDLEDIEQLMHEDDSTPEEPSIPDRALGAISPHKAEERKERMQSILLPPKPVLPNDFTSHTRPASPKVYLNSDAQSPKQELKVDTNIQSITAQPTESSLPEWTPITDLSAPSSPLLVPSQDVLQTAQPVDTTEPTQDPMSIPSLELIAPPGPLPPAPRPSRLAQVGRIPQVVSTRVRETQVTQERQEHRPPSQSFSRPFLADQPRPTGILRTSVDLSSPLYATTGPVEPYPVLQGLNALAHGTAIATMSPTAEAANRVSEFFKFPPRKDSEVSYSSSSGVWSFPPTNSTAIVPGPDAPQSEDEVWNEYNDLIDEVLSPLEGPNKFADDSTIRSGHPSLEPPPLKIKASNTIDGDTVDRVQNPPSLHLRRSRLLAVLHAAQSPTSSVSLSEILQDYGDKHISIIDPNTGRLSFPSTTRVSTGSISQNNRPSSTRSSLPASLPLSTRQSKATLGSVSDKDRESASANRYRDTRLMELAETQADGLVSMANLRFGALMTSKWLSFGRVLFSPAHFELKNPSEDRVLVIDGLGKDWSYYCALTYPEATVYNLGPGASSSTTSNSSSSEPWSTLRNHRHILHASLATAFPFPQSFFACVVLRFPPALASSVHRSVLSECKRVLRPGGHLELSVLDLDLVNMGNRARRAVRSLKVRMQVADEHVSLRNISDEIMAGLGRKGFAECNRCFVGVPVAGRLPSSDEAETRRKGSTASSIGKASTSAPKAKNTSKPEVSFSELLNAQSSSESTDDSITDMVARVGRWWYSRCYESLVLPEAGQPGSANSGNLLESSIWRDENLIKECEKRGTSFKLLIGYAQKPEVGVRRTVSV